MRLLKIGFAFLLTLRLSGWCADAPPTAVATLKPERRDVTRWIRLPATVAPDSEVTLFTKVSGFLKDFQVDIGDRLRPGQVIGRLDAPEYEQDVKLAEAQLAAAQADVATAQALLASEQLQGKALDAKARTLQAEIAKAQAAAKLAQSEFERVRKLAARDAATERERENQECNLDATKAAVEAAQSQLGELTPARELWKTSVAAKEAALEAARSKVAIAKAGLERARIWNAYTTLTVPAIGTHPDRAMMVTKRFVSNGDMVTGGVGPRTGLQPVLTLTTTDPVRVAADVPEHESIFIQPGTVASIALYVSGADKPILAKVARSSNALATEARTLRTEMDVPNPEGRIKPGMMVNAEIALETHKATLAVPASAVLIEKKGASVFTVAGGKAKAIAVTLGFQDHGMVEVIEPSLSTNTSLIQNAQAGISDGTPVSVK